VNRDIALLSVAVAQLETDFILTLKRGRERGEIEIEILARSKIWLVKRKQTGKS
jgi:hypothetical protein